MSDAQSSTGVLTQDEVAKLLDCEPTTVQARALSGELPGLKFGRGWVFPQEALLSRLNEMALEQSAERRGQKAGPAAAVAVGLAPRSRRRTPVPLPDLP